MPHPLNDYFAQEAGEYLDALEPLVRAEGAPDPVAFFRLARGVRGSAQVAGAVGVAAVAERLEEGARALRDGVLAWSPELRDRALATVDDLRALVDASGAWGAEQDERAASAAARWSDAGGRRRTDQSAGGDQLLAFVRREIVGVVAEMDRTLAELERSPGSREPLRAVLRRMRPVRGVAGLETLAPVLEVLEGVEDGAHDVLHRAVPVAAPQLELFRAAREALRAAGQSAEPGALEGLPELERFRELRDGAEAAAADADAGVVPVSALFEEGAGPHLVSSPAAPVPAADGARASGLAEAVESFLRIESIGFLDRGEGLVAGARAHRRFGRAARELAELAGSVRELALTYGAAGIAAEAGRAAEALRAAATPEEARRALAALRARIPGAPPAAVLEEDDDAPVPAAAPASASASADDDVVPVESLLYDRDAALREALELRPRLAELLGTAAGRGTPAADALDELFGLLEHALQPR